MESDECVQRHTVEVGWEGPHRLCEEILVSPLQMDKLFRKKPVQPVKLGLHGSCPNLGGYLRRKPAATAELYTWLKAFFAGLSPFK